jgi:hypothetical protein
VGFYPQIDYFIIQAKRRMNERIDEEQFVSKGAEQKVYIKDGERVIKLNDVVPPK